MCFLAPIRVNWIETEFIYKPKYINVFFNHEMSLSVLSVSLSSCAYVFHNFSAPHSSIHRFNCEMHFYLFSGLLVRAIVLYITGEHIHIHLHL